MDKKQQQSTTKKAGKQPAEETFLDPKTRKTISRKSAIVGAGGAIAAGAALGSMAPPPQVTEIFYDTDGDGIANTLLSDTNNDGIFETAEVISENQPPIEPNQPWSPFTAPMLEPGIVNDNMSFAEAFAAAREELGPGGVFQWQGQYYNTFYAEELDSNNQPLVDYQITDPHDLPVIDHSSGVQPGTQAPVIDTPVISDVEQLDINPPITGQEGPHVINVDVDMDGKVDMIFEDYNFDGRADIIYVDENQDGQFTENERIVVNDPAGLTIPAEPTDGSFMTADLNLDKIDDVLVADFNSDQVADVIGIDANSDQQITENEIQILNPSAMEGLQFGPASIEYSGEVAPDIPADVPDSVLDSMTDDLSNLEDNFDELNQWA